MEILDRRPSQIATFVASDRPSVMEDGRCCPLNPKIDRYPIPLPPVPEWNVTRNRRSLVVTIAENPVELILQMSPSEDVTMMGKRKRPYEDSKEEAGEAQSGTNHIEPINALDNWLQSTEPKGSADQWKVKVKPPALPEEDAKRNDSIATQFKGQGRVGLHPIFTGCPATHAMVDDLDDGRYNETHAPSVPFAQRWACAFNYPTCCCCDRQICEE